MTVSEAMLDGMKHDDLYDLSMRIQSRLFADDAVETARKLEHNLPDFIRRVTAAADSLRQNVAGREADDLPVSADTLVSFNVVRGREDYARAIRMLEDATGCRMELVEAVTKHGDVKYAKLRLSMRAADQKIAS